MQELRPALSPEPGNGRAWAPRMTVDSARVKLTRALPPLQRAVSEMNGWMESGGLIIHPFQFEGLATNGLGVTVTTAAPDDLRAEAGDAINGLRSALDHIAWDAHQRWPAPKVGNVYFPLPKSLDKLTAYKWLSTVPAEVREIFLAPQDLDSPEPLFWRLGELSNKDKHRALHVVAVPQHSFQVTMPTMPEGKSVGIGFPGSSVPLDPGNSGPVAWVYWHDLDGDGAPLPESADLPELPELRVNVEFGVSQDNVSMTFSELMRVGIAIEGVLNNYAAYV